MSTLGNEIELMEDKIPEKILTKIRNRLSSNKEGFLNQLFDFKWCWQIIGSPVLVKENTYQIQGRLMLPGMGFRDGIGTGIDVQAANDAAFANAIEKLGFVLSGENKEEPKEEEKKSRFSNEQINQLKKIQSQLNIKDNYELVSYLTKFDVKFASINELSVQDMDSFLNYLDEIANTNEDDLF